MLGINEGRERRLRRIEPFAGRRLAADVLRGTDDLEVLVLQLEIEFLPSWQIESAPSPGSPGDQQHLRPAKIREVDRPTLTIGDCKIGRDTGREKPAPDRLHFAKAPDSSVAIGHDRLTDLARERGQIEIVATNHVPREWNA